MSDAPGAGKPSGRARQGEARKYTIVLYWELIRSKAKPEIGSGLKWNWNQSNICCWKDEEDNGINFSRGSCHNNPSEKMWRIEPPQKPNKDHYWGALNTGGGGFDITVKWGVTVSRNFLCRRIHNLLCTVQYGASMIVSEHVAPPLSDISTFKAVFGLRRLELSDSSLIICLPWASGSLSSKQPLTICESKS